VGLYINNKIVTYFYALRETVVSLTVYFYFYFVLLLFYWMFCNSVYAAWWPRPFDLGTGA